MVVVNGAPSCDVSADRVRGRGKTVKDRSPVPFAIPCLEKLHGISSIFGSASGIMYQSRISR